MNISFPFKATALRVEQPMGSFYVTVLPVELLLQVCASDTLTAKLSADGSSYKLEGTQRAKREDRMSEIAEYINRVDAAFPNSVIIAANHDLKTGFDQGEAEDISHEIDQPGADNESKAWRVHQDREESYLLEIPSNSQMAAIIDGQHRLFSFTHEKVKRSARENMQLVCSVFMDLPKSLQAQVFAVINSTQKRVDRSLTYELFGYNVESEPANLWTPDKLAVFLSRKMGTEEGSPLQGRVTVAPKADVALEERAKSEWQISTAVVVDGILRLFSNNPKRDSNWMHQKKSLPRKTLLQLKANDSSPLRSAFIEGNDLLIYTMVSNCLKVVDELWWSRAGSNSVILKTIGVQAVFDILRRKVAEKALQEKDVRTSFFRRVLEPAKNLDFSEESLRNYSGAGRIRVRRAIEDELKI